jgi:hypothetical protein
MQTATVTPGKTFVSGELVTNAKLNQLSAPTVAITGTVDTSGVTDDAVTAAKLAFGATYYCAVLTSSNVITLTASGHTLADATLTAGLLVVFKADATNTSTVDIKLSSAGTAKNLYKDASQELAAGDIRSGQMCVCRYDGTQWQLVSNLGNGQWDRYATTTTAAAGVAGTNYAGTFAPTVTALTNGTRVLVKWHATNLGAADFTTNSLTAKAIRKLNDAALSAGDILLDQVSELVYDATLDHWLLTSPVFINTPATVVGLARTLVIKNNTADPTFKVGITADDVVLKNSSGLSYLAEAVSVTANMTASGANGLDTGAEASSTWYYLWVIYNGTTVASLLSTSATAPTLPSGYTYKAMVGAVYNDSGSNFDTMYQSGSEVWLDETDAASRVFTAQAGSNNVWTSASLAAIVPPIAKTVAGTMGLSVAATVTNDCQFAVAGESTGLTVCSHTAGGPGAPVANAIDTFILGWPFDLIPLRTAQTIWWKTYTATAATFRLTVRRYTIG